ncbi:MAG: cyclopentanol dehydrogenase, partial [SAR202 cluster bacterium]|nr:cyclopentanol dehydrogenase [SAR202 cluster bacterium]
MISGGARGMGAEVVIGDISEEDGKAIEAQV